MENSFFEYRDEGHESECDSEIIDNSLMDESYSQYKTPAKKNHTVFVPESDDAESEEDSFKEDSMRDRHKLKIGLSNVRPLLLCSSDDEERNEDITKELNTSKSISNVSSSEDEEPVSPEMIPRRRRQVRSSDSPDSLVSRKTKKRIMLIESDTDNSIIIENNKNRKMPCLKDTPLKVDIKTNSIDTGESNEEANDEDLGDQMESDEIDANVDEQDKTSDDDKYEISSERQTFSEEEYEEALLMSKATRLSIMGVIPKENDSDTCDFIQSDESQHISRPDSVDSLPEVEVTKIQEVSTDSDTSRITCSPFQSPHREITNVKKQTDDEVCDVTHFDADEIYRVRKSNVKKHKDDEVCDLTHFDSDEIYPVRKSNVRKQTDDEVCDLTQFDSDEVYPVRKTKDLYNKVKEEVIDDDVAIVSGEPVLITLSSDDEEEVLKESSNVKKSPKMSIKEPKLVDGSIKQYFVPESYPNQIVYVKKHVRENELNKLNSIKEDLHNIRHLLSNMDVETLPDGGVKLVQRLAELEEKVRQQGDKVANMVVEPDEVTPDVIANDGFDKENKGLSWDDIQKGSNAVQPRMFGKQAMTTHVTERNLILERLRDLYESLESRPNELAEAPQPEKLRTTLLPHQRHALAWIQWRETQRPAGGILADDMGLGKTITMISLVASDKDKNEEVDEDDENASNSKLLRGGTLVVCPASLLQQWAGEVSKHCKPHSLSVFMHHGASRPTQPHKLVRADFVLTTYHILQRESLKTGALTRVLWRRVILDEAHVIRNHKAATSCAVSALHSRRRWALTGTPLHNKDLDLFALLKFLRCTPFNELTMWKKWIDNKSLGGQERLNTILRCIMLRRTKLQLQERGELLSLPTRVEHQTHVTLEREEMNVYQKVLVFSKTLFAQFLHQSAEKQAATAEFSGLNKDSVYHKMHKRMVALQGAKPVKAHEILVLLLRLRQVCCHCGLIAVMLGDGIGDVAEDEGSKDLLAELKKLTIEDSKSRRKSDDQEDEEKYVEGTTAAEAIRSIMSPNNPVFDLKRQSSKMKVVLEILNKNVFSKPGEKAVIVSQWTTVLELLEGELRKARVRCVTLNGRVPVSKRPAVVDALNDSTSDVRVMFLSLSAGGVGLNLCGANHLLLLDPHWNPQLENQAQDRIYRVGQTRPVHIYRFMCLDTVEQSIRKLQESKLKIADNVLTGDKTGASHLSVEELKVLFNMGPGPGH